MSALDRDCAAYTLANESERKIDEVLGSDIADYFDEEEEDHIRGLVEEQVKDLVRKEI